MYSLGMVVIFLLIILWNVSIIINYIQIDDDDDDNNIKMIDEQFFGDNNITKHYNSEYISNDYKDTGPRGFIIKEFKNKSLKFTINESNRFKISYPPAEYRFFRSMINHNLCYQYTLECIYYRSEYSRSKLSIDEKTGEEYNPCQRFVEPCFGISEYEYKAIKKFKSLKDY
ncbi:hypothetical protein QQG55_36055 [Brugia pahangi]|uniref:Astacin domain-containing protein n=1 Tax=Brugia pahangi TaxID=6280 RepID=A0A0N4TQJ4_BRUPA|nr:unnamed protein product [Brugia pahangi]